MVEKGSKLCSEVFMACCCRCEGTVLGYRAFHTVFPLQPNPWGFAWMQWEPGVFNLIPNSSSVCAWREMLHGSVGYLNVSRDHSKERRSSIQGCKSQVKLGSVSKEDGVVLGFFFNNFFS